MDVSSRSRIKSGTGIQKTRIEEMDPGPGAGMTKEKKLRYPSLNTFEFDKRQENFEFSQNFWQYVTSSRSDPLLLHYD